MESHISRDLGDQKTHIGTDKKGEDFYFIKFNQCVNAFQGDLAPA